MPAIRASQYDSFGIAPPSWGRIIAVLAVFTALATLLALCGAS